MIESLIFTIKRSIWVGRVSFTKHVGSSRRSNKTTFTFLIFIAVGVYVEKQKYSHTYGCV